MTTDKTQGDVYHRISLTPRQIIKFLIFAAENLGPLIVYLVLSHFYSLKVAIAGTVGYTIVDVARRLWFKVAIPKLYWISGGMTVGFGIVDLLAKTPFMLRFEVVISNLITAVIFFMGARGKVSMIQEMVEQKRGAPFVNRPDLQRFFFYITLLWAIYFLIKAVFYLWVGLAYSLNVVMEVRAIFGNITLGLMIALTATQSRRIYWSLYNHGWLPERPTEAKITVRN
jgi:intracellular septation protein A